ncbi:hypothetical protein [Dongia deserti]|uniref:hypothetical protein n=1 Tax=Dongia deserti TaxID=2268030 RepID=UPI0013C4AEBA|nr:hypothetical protein [Dongia deserti]
MPVAASGAMDDIDCSSSSFEFAGAGYHVDCQRSVDQVRSGGSTGASEIDVMTISGDDPRMFMTVVGVRVAAPRLYLVRQNLGQNFRETFNDIKAEDWKGIGNKNGYDTAEFTAVISGLPSSCVAIQRYLNPAWGGFKRRIIGMGCSPTSRESVYSAIAKLAAPGD